MCGIGPITAAVIIGQSGSIDRFASKDHYASYNATAPVEASSGPKARHRLNQRGNRQLNWAIHMIAVTQIRQPTTPGRAYYRRKLAEGKSTREALRCLKRRISDAVWRQLQTDRSDDQTQNNDWPRWPSSRGNLVTYRSPDTLRANGLPKKPQPASV